MEEYVKITLKHYHDLVEDNKKANKLYDFYNEMSNIVDEDEFEDLFEKGSKLSKRIFELYAEMYKVV